MYRMTSAVPGAVIAIVGAALLPGFVTRTTGVVRTSLGMVTIRSFWSAATVAAIDVPLSVADRPSV